MNPKSSLFFTLQCVLSETRVSDFVLYLLLLKIVLTDFLQVSKRNLVHLSVLSSFFHLQAHFGEQATIDASSPHSSPFSAREAVPAVPSNLHVHPRVSQEQKCLWEMSDQLRLICTCTKSPVCPQCTTFSAQTPSMTSEPCQALLGSLGTPTPHPNVPACTTWLSSTGRDNKAQPSVCGNKPPSSHRDPRAGMVWCPPAMPWCCLCPSAGQNTAELDTTVIRFSKHEQ